MLALTSGTSLKCCPAVMLRCSFAALLLTERLQCAHLLCHITLI